VLHDYSESMSAVTGPSLDLPFPPANGDGVRADGCDHKLHGSHIIYDHTQIRDHARCRYLNACSDSEYRRPAEVRLAASRHDRTRASRAHSRVVRMTVAENGNGRSRIWQVVRVTPADGVNFIPYIKLSGVE
jgi:hypothetical protein